MAAPEDLVPATPTTGPAHYRRGEALLEQMHRTDDPAWMKTLAAMASAEFAAAQAAATGLIAASQPIPLRSHGSMEWAYAIMPTQAPPEPAPAPPPAPEPEPVPTWNPPPA